MAERQSYRMAKDRENVQAASKGPSGLSRRYVRRASTRGATRCGADPQGAWAVPGSNAPVWSARGFGRAADANLIGCRPVRSPDRGSPRWCPRESAPELIRPPKDIPHLVRQIDVHFVVRVDQIDSFVSGPRYGGHGPGEEPRHPLPSVPPCRQATLRRHQSRFSVPYAGNGAAIELGLPAIGGAYAGQPS